MRTNCLHLILCLFVQFSYGQSAYNFFVDDSIKKVAYAKEVDNLRAEKLKSFDKKYLKDYQEVYNESFEHIKAFILSKETITDTAINNYLQRIVKEIVQNNKELSNLKLRIVFTRNLWTNAYSMGDGTIAVNAGMLFYLKNEAELAFIICHELAHYYLDHSGKSIDQYVSTINSDDYQQKLKAIAKKKYSVNKELDLLAKASLFDSRKHSRIHEAEADYYAFNFMRKSPFNLNSIVTCLGLLDVLPDSSFFTPLKIEELLDNKDYRFKKNWIEAETAIFSELSTLKDTSNKKEIDSLKTHPDCKKRIALLKDTVAKYAKENAVYFITDVSNFHKVKEKFLMEGIEYDYTNNDLSKNLYYALLLYQNKKETAYAIYAVARAFNTIFDKQLNHQLGTAIQAENNTFDKDYNVLLKMLSRLTLTEIAAINYHFCKSNLNTGLLYKGFDAEWKKAQLNFTN